MEADILCMLEMSIQNRTRLHWLYAEWEAPETVLAGSAVEPQDKTGLLLWGLSVGTAYLVS